ncbi:hypothetical protein [Olleya sp. Bg11-27]|uniref:hypothetical protein n=1 Tax=Olleya sp. Bg11-27 TaxID=2058135 RepID=UPI000C307C61|nr:hypothetical protein [Olleya sp. Bg11-27]AUC77305.1 hypothetical protein CW732_17145 [Olleya sp. Bg11-27]
MKIKQNALLAELPLEQDLPRPIAISGYVKQYEKVIHLYYDLELLVYLEIRLEDVISQKDSESPKEPSILYLNANAKVREVILPSDYQSIQNFLDQPTIEDFLEELKNEKDYIDDSNPDFAKRRPKFPRRTRRLLRRFRRGRCYNWKW